ncbi:MAG: hypothetical protein LQ338_002698 [Usnochroma carphineum]|nr:MAG: hypothetical protein LQ338_002698 [Usnochroma carphineum]
MAISPAPESQQRPTTVEKLCSGAQSRFSAFFHGQSVLTRERYRTAQVGLKAANSYRTREHSERDGLRRAGPVSRSRTSTRSVIDSPISNPGSPHTEELWQYRGAFFRPVSTLGPAPRVTTVIRGGVEDRNTTRHERLLLCRKPKHKRGCFAAIEDRHIKHKIVGSLISGSLLVLFLTIYLALAVSGSIQSTNFHVVMIVFTLVLTMVFCHFLIRLCMLSFRIRLRERRRTEREPSVMDEDGYAQPETPIPIILARDEELGLHDNASDNDSIRPVQHPPPAYGQWRSSVRADPDLIHWQQTDHSMRQCEERTPDLAQHPAMRPPTYHSREQLREPEASSSLYSASPLPMLQPVAFRW